MRRRPDLKFWGRREAGIHPRTLAARGMEPVGSGHLQSAGTLAMLADFIPALPVLAAYAVASVVLGLTPGPDMTFFLSRTIAQSRAAGFAALFGASTGLVVHTVLVAAGLSVLLAASVTAFTVLKIVGAAYLAWLAYDAIRNGSALSLRSGRKRSRSAPSISKACSSTSSTPRSSSSS